MRSSSLFDLRFLSRRFAQDKRGAAAVEFAVILPTMLLIAVGTSELCNAVAVDRKLTIMARAVSDLAAQDDVISDAEMTNILDAGKVMLQPYPTSSLKIRVSSIKIDADKKATVEWSDASSGAQPRGKGQQVTVPPGLLIPNTHMIWGEVAYDFKPVAFSVKSLWSFKYEDNEFFAAPRETARVCRSTCT